MKEQDHRQIEAQDKRLLKDQDRRLVVLLRLTSDAIYRVRRKELRKFGVSVEEWGVLSIVRFIGDKATPAEISRWLFREHHSVVALLNRMAKKGLLVKAKDLERRNMTRISLSEKGEKLYLTSAKAKAHHDLLSDLPPAERRALIKNLKVLREHALKDLGIDYRPKFP